MEVDVLIIGGGSSGTAAGIQAARMGAKTLIIEQTQWLGGMITSAGVSAFDGNKYATGGGIFGELRKKLEDYYGGPEKTYTGWISLTCFEPKIGKNFLHKMAEDEKNLKVLFETSLIDIIRDDDKILGAHFKKKDGTEIEVRAKVTIEATEFGDVLALAEIPYRLGRDSKADTGEPDAPNKADDVVQDITYCAILKKYENEAPKVKPPEEFDFSIFKCSVKDDCDNKNEDFLNHKLHDWKSFITYAALPNNKYLLNWPFRANDYPTTLELYEKPNTREEHFKKAKNLTLAYVYYIQNQLGHPEWGLAVDEFPTNDSLPFIPYVRESRRIKGARLLIEEDVIPAPLSFRPPLIKDSVAVGDYFLDHHHSKFFMHPEKRLIEELPPNAPFQIPFECLIPEKTDGLVVAEKSISVSHIVNGCTRLQPVVMLVGQAAGAIAAISIKYNLPPRNISHYELQTVLLKAGCQLFPYTDLWNTHPAFEPVQRLALLGLFIDSPNFSFEPEKEVTREEVAEWLGKIKINTEPDDLIGLTRADAFIKIFGMIKASR